MRTELWISLSIIFSIISFLYAPQAKAQEADNICPLIEGSQIPQGTIRTVEGEKVELPSVVQNKPTILLFYRGGWCPYCNEHLKDIRNAQEALVDMGYQVIAISPDKPAKLRETQTELDMTYTLYSDSDMEVTKKFGLAFDVSDQTLAKYDEHGINLTKASGEEHQMLPVPAVYITDREGLIRFAHVNVNYKNRLDAEILKAVADKLIKKQ